MRNQREQKEGHGSVIDVMPKPSPTVDEGLMSEVDLYQARGSMLAQMGRVLTKEAQDLAREEVLAHKFL